MHSTPSPRKQVNAKHVAHTIMDIQGHIEIAARSLVLPAAIKHTDARLAGLHADMMFAARLMERHVRHVYALHAYNSRQRVL